MFVGVTWFCEFEEDFMPLSLLYLGCKIWLVWVGLSSILLDWVFLVKRDANGNAGYAFFFFLWTPTFYRTLLRTPDDNALGFGIWCYKMDKNWKELGSLILLAEELFSIAFKLPL